MHEKQTKIIHNHGSMYRWEGKKMYTLLIADDEPLIRNGVKKIIDWESLGFSEIFLAEDGQ